MLGHGDREPDQFSALLTQLPVQAVVDIRARAQDPRLGFYTQASLRECMEQLGIVYHWAGRQLGGFRAPLPDSAHTGLGGALRGYADYMQTDTFDTAATQLLNMAARMPLAVLCSERLPGDCHRRLLADYLLLSGVDVRHVIESDDIRVHLLSPEARRESAALVYDQATGHG